MDSSNLIKYHQIPNFEIKMEPMAYDFPPKPTSINQDIQDYSSSDGQTTPITDGDDSFYMVDILWPLFKNNVTNQSCHLCSKQNCDSRRHSNECQWIYPTCENCGIELNDLIELIINESSRSTEKCELCLIQYNSDDVENKNHVLKHFERDNVRTMEQLCADCASVSNMEDSNDYLFVEKLEEVVLVDCKWCANTLCANALKQHEKRCYKKPKMKSSEPRPQSFECVHCPKKYSSYKNLANHIMSVHDLPENQVGFQCRFCDEMFTRSQRLIHEREVHMHPETGLYKCDFCERKCKSASELEYHRFKHTTPFICDICGHRSGMKRRLEEHMLTHSNIRDHVCEQCDEAFKTPHLLKRHKERRHSNARPFKCKQCEKAYKDATDLRRHSRSHGGVTKDFKCHMCQKAFFEAKLLRYHMKIHDRQGGRGKIDTVILVKNIDMAEDNVLLISN